MITVQIDSFQHSMPELREIFISHHRELGLLKWMMPLDPQYDEYVRREATGILFLVTARRDGKIVGYYIAQAAPGFHYRSTLTGTMDICYVVPEERNRGLVLPLFRHTEQELRRRGVKVWYSGYKTENPMGLDRLLPMFGFQPADTYMIRALI